MPGYLRLDMSPGDGQIHRSNVESQAPLGAQRLGVEGADFERAGELQRHDDTVTGDRGADDARPFRQRCRVLDHAGPFLEVENPIAQDGENDADPQHSGEGGNAHQPTHPRDELGLFSA